MLCQPLYQVQPRGRLDDPADLTLFQPEGSLLEFLLHVAPAEEAPVRVLVDAQM
jgi:hypothetical protein